MNALKVFAMASVSILVMTAVFVVGTGGGAEDNSPSRSELILQSPSEYDEGNVTIRGDIGGYLYDQINVGNRTMSVDGIRDIDACGLQLNSELNEHGINSRPGNYPPLEAEVTGTLKGNPEVGYRLQCRSLKVDGRA